MLITGASEGMGRSAARQLAEKGANVILVSRSANKLQEAMAEAKVRVPSSVYYAQLWQSPQP